MTPLFAQNQTVVLRQLTSEYRQELETMISHSPVAHLFAAEHLETYGLPANDFPMPARPPYGFVGIFEREYDNTSACVLDEQVTGYRRAVPQALRTMAHHLLGTASAKTTHEYATEHLVGAIWLGGNCVPVQVPERCLEATATFILRHSKYIASIFGLSDMVIPLWQRCEHGFRHVLDERPNQPLLYLSPDAPLDTTPSLHRENLVAPPIDGRVRWARTSDRASLLQASVAMFTEEVGYDPLERDAAGYTRRVSDFISGGRTLVATNTEGVVIFKTDLGLAYENCCQLQGVWLHPAYRGNRLSETLLAQACQLIRPRYEHISLYVNDYNLRARALYAAVGFKQTNTFATILF